MTMEMWWLGFYMDRLRLFLFLPVNLLVLLVLIGLSYFAGIRRTIDLKEDALDTFEVPRWKHLFEDETH